MRMFRRVARRACACETSQPATASAAVTMIAAAATTGSIRMSDAEMRATVRMVRHAGPVNPTQQTWAIVGATLGAALLGVIVGFIGTAYLQGRQSKKDARNRLEEALAELLAAAQDLMIGARVIRQAHERRTQPRFYLRLAAMIMRDYPAVSVWRDLVDLSSLKALLASALEADRYQLDESRIVALDLATVVTAKANRYFAVVALITLGQDKEITAAVRELTPKVTALMEGIGARKREYERLNREMQKALEGFRDLADKCLGNARHRRFWQR